MMKRLFQLSFLMMALLLPATAMAADYVSVNGVIYLIDDNEASVYYGKNFSGDLVIPESVSYNGTNYVVTTIATSAFYGCINLTSVTIPNTVTTIGNSAFNGCSSLSSVTIGNSVTIIGTGAFFKCKSLSSVVIPNSVITIGNQAFSGCSSMTSLTLGNSVTEIKYRAFYGCSSLTNIVIPNLVTTLDRAFENCSSLLSVTIGSSVTSISRGTFFYCPLSSINVARDNPVYDSRDNCNAIIETSSNTLICGCMNTMIPNTVTAIGDYAFYECTGLTNITIPASVTSIGNYAFYGCVNLANISIPNTVNVIGNSAFDWTAWLDNQSDGMVYIGTIAYKYKGDMPSGTRIVIKEGTTAIAGAAFYNCSGLESIEIPNTVASIIEGTFCYCSGLTNITVSSGNPVYDSRENCNAIIETSTNTLITGCQNTIIPTSVIMIAKYAFFGCTTLTEVTIPNSVITIGDFAFKECSGLANLVLGNSVKSIGAQSFYNCTGLTSVTIPNSVTSIGGWAFYGCTGLIEVSIPNSVTELGQGVFRECSGLTAVVIPNSIAAIPQETFMGCTGLTSVIIPNSVTTIDYWAFYGCSSLTNVSIPGSVTTINNMAFGDCTSLKDVYSFIQLYYNNENGGLSMGNSVFYLEDGNYSDRTLHVLPGCLSLYQQDSRWSDYFGNIVEMSGFEVDGIYYEFIGDNAVAVSHEYGHKYTGDVIIPETVTYEGMTFRVTAIGDDAFESCTGLTGVTIPESVTSIGNWAFAGCIKLKDVAIPNTVTSIGSYAFRRCYSLTDVTIPLTVTSIGYFAFEYCYALTSVAWNARDCKIVEEYQGEYDVYNLFAYCPSLKKITIGSEVERIGDEIFCIFDPNYCNIDTVVCLATQPPVITEDCFWTYTYNDATLLVPQQSMNQYATAEGWKEFANIEGVSNGLMIGDTDGDGKVSIADVTALIDCLLSGDLTEINAVNADVDGDGRISIADVTELIDRLLAGN